MDEPVLECESTSGYVKHHVAFRDGSVTLTVGGDSLGIDARTVS